MILYTLIGILFAIPVYKVLDLLIIDNNPSFFDCLTYLLSCLGYGVIMWSARKWVVIK